jgi:hypothetical protein
VRLRLENNTCDCGKRVRLSGKRVRLVEKSDGVEKSQTVWEKMIPLP